MLMTALPAGFLATTGEHSAAPPGPVAATAVACGPASLVYWGHRPVAGAPSDRPTFVLSRVARRTGGRVSDADLIVSMRDRPGALTDLLPPFGAVAAGDTGVRMVADSMGFQHLYHTAAGAPVLSSTALGAARVTRAGLDDAAVGVQSLLGWQLGQRTLFEGVRKLGPGAVASAGEDGLTLTDPTPTAREPIDRRTAVLQAAALLRTSLAAVLDEYPQAVLQLTGGMDSRLLLSAIPPSRRRGLRAMTLDVPGKGDVAIASSLAQRDGLEHDVRGLTDVAATSPAEAWALCRAEATRLDAMADPVALAAQRIAERAFEQGVRISGLGGETARGFYYTGRITERTHTRKDAERLALWRMFVNDAVEPGVLTAGFSSWARAAALDAVHAALVAGGPQWLPATDELYLRHRMQRWAGATDTAVSDERVVINPMLDKGFLDLASRLRPRDKAGSLFLAELQMELDPELGRIPLDGRPAPASYAHPSPWHPLRQSVDTATRFARKAAQRVRRDNRAPAGGVVLAARVVAHWRAEPQTVQGLWASPYLDESWLSRMLGGAVEPRPSTVALLTNLLVATGQDEPAASGSGASSS